MPRRLLPPPCPPPWRGQLGPKDAKHGCRRGDRRIAGCLCNPYRVGAAGGGWQPRVALVGSAVSLTPGLRCATPVGSGVFRGSYSLALIPRTCSTVASKRRSRPSRWSYVSSSLSGGDFSWGLSGDKAVTGSGDAGLTSSPGVGGGLPFAGGCVFDGWPGWVFSAALGQELGDVGCGDTMTSKG